LHFIAVSKPDSDSSAERCYSGSYSNQTSSSIIHPDAYCNAYLNSCSNFKTATINIADAEFTVVYRPLRRKQELERISRSMVL
jgi:hypothetical protein